MNRGTRLAPLADNLKLGSGQEMLNVRTPPRRSATAVGAAFTLMLTRQPAMDAPMGRDFRESTGGCGLNKSMVKGVVIGGLAAAAVAASGITGYRAMNTPEFAEVLAVKEVNQTIATPREDCRDVQVQKQAAVKDENRITGTVAGGVAGGLLGSLVGGGKGKTLATVAGAAAGGYAGNQVQKDMQHKDVVTTTERRCKTVNEASQKRLGYDVSYRLAGKEDVVRLSYDPGATIPVKDGQLQLAPPAAKP